MTADVELKSLLNTIRADPAVPEAIKKKAEDTLGSGPVYVSDVVIYRIVVTVLGATVILTVAGGLGLAFLGSPDNYKIPPELIALGSAAVGALAGLLAPSPGQTKGS
ncbi:hypothetical protein [Pseudolabrys sp. FHR47]|uniref:hypothetical protein n=1 Tax=Pseudolabrys sp. FHR47 TaxID=2562284 RepID=UPI00197D9BD6|nr:hypothetical protein [Pseudolabrys sp. FHR47]